jgi:hypothetical protein
MHLAVNHALVWGNQSGSPVTVMNTVISTLPAELHVDRTAARSALLATEWHDKNTYVLSDTQTQTVRIWHREGITGNTNNANIQTELLYTALVHSKNMTKRSFFLLHSANLRHVTEGFTSPPKEVVLRIFSPWKIRQLRPGLYPRTWVLKASTQPLDHQSRLCCIWLTKSLIISQTNHNIRLMTLSL